MFYMFFEEQAFHFWRCITYILHCTVFIREMLHRNSIQGLYLRLEEYLIC